MVGGVWLDISLSIKLLNDHPSTIYWCVQQVDCGEVSLACSNVVPDGVSKTMCCCTTFSFCALVHELVPGHHKVCKVETAAEVLSNLESFPT